VASEVSINHEAQIVPLLLTTYKHRQADCSGCNTKEMDTVCLCRHVLSLMICPLLCRIEDSLLQPVLVETDALLVTLHSFEHLE